MSDEAFTLSNAASVLQQLEPQLAVALQERLTSLCEQVETARGKVRDKLRENAQLQRSIEERREVMARVADVEGHNRIFATRASQDERISECLPTLQTREVLECERHRMASEDLAVERLRAFEAKAASLRARESEQQLAQEARGVEAQLRELNVRIEELQRVHFEADKKAVENRALQRKIDKLRHGNPRWR